MSDQPMDLTKFLTEQVAASGRMWRSSFRVALMLACVIVMAAGFLPAEQNASAAVAYHSRLAAQKSPYLLAHAHDLVDWHPWGPEAFAEARSKNKLIFLSVGYSSCHWCHVMQREDFENPQVAQLINRYFISILVDREERPEVDNQYLAVCEMLTGSGGWPLNVIMTPDRKPFFASTYIPRESERGRTGMLELIPEIEQKWKRNPAQLMNGGEKLAKLLEHNLDVNAPGQALGAAALKSASNQLASSFDSRNGGFGGAPKFPPALDILFLLRAWKRDGDANALKMAEKTLDAMRGGGIFDQVGFGFHRYATDAEWRTPHFEKMLYDQALLAIAYTEAYQATRQPRYETTARQILTYVRRDLTSPEGAFYDAQDADSGGAEGGYYLWTEKQIQEALDPAAAYLLLNAFDIRKHGNFPGARNGENILYWRGPSAALAAQITTPADELRARVQTACARLLAARQKRPHPQIDEKIITGWNGLMIAAFAQAAQAFGDPQYAQTAARAADFLLKRARTSDGRLLHVYEGGEAAIPGNLNDYAFLTWGLLELYEADFRTLYLQAAVNLNSQLMRHFWDSNYGGFFFTADDDQNRLAREKNIDDVELPSGNAVEILNLLRLSDMTGQTALMDKAVQTEKAFAGAILKDPDEYPEALVAADYALGPSYEVVIAGNSKAPATQAMLQAAETPFLPDKVVLLRPTESSSPGIIHLADYTRYESGMDGGPTAYVCLKYDCKLPTNDTGKMLQLLGVGPR